MKSFSQRTNRFDALISHKPAIEPPPKPSANYFKNPTPSINPYSRRAVVIPEPPKKKEYVATATEFPSLSSTKPAVETSSTKLCFADKLKKQVVKEKKVEEVPPGWVSLQQDPTTKKIIWKEGLSTYVSDESKEIPPIHALHALVDTYYKQIEDYDRLWGEGAYEDFFRFKNYDYDYFDKLDEQWEEELEEDAGGVREMS
jgi:hypothetical protein